MPDKFYYLESLESVALEEKKSWLNIHRVGTWNHPVYKKVEGSVEKFKKIIENFENKIIGRDVPMDTRHDHGGSLGWVEKLKIIGNKLMALVAFTPLGEKLVSEKIYKYISPEYDENYENKETGAKYGPALLGIAATNFPFLTGLEPMALSEDLQNDGELSKIFENGNGLRKIKRKKIEDVINLTDGQLEILNSIKRCEWRKLNEISDEEREVFLDDVTFPLTIPQKRMIAKLQQIVYLPMPNFYSCRLRNPADFQKDTYAQMTRQSDGKTYSIVMARLKGKETMTEQAYRYDKKTWSSAEARSHCERHKGNFELEFDPGTLYTKKYIPSIERRYKEK